MGTKIFDRWLSHPTDRPKDFVKLHAAIDDRGAAFSIAITDGTTNDSIVFPYLIGDVDARLEARDVQVQEGAGGVPQGVQPAEKG